MKKDNYLQIRLSSKDKLIIKNNAKKMGMTVTEYIMYLINKEEYIDEIDNLSLQLLKIMEEREIRNKTN